MFEYNLEYFERKCGGNLEEKRKKFRGRVPPLNPLYLLTFCLREELFNTCTIDVVVVAVVIIVGVFAVVAFMSGVFIITSETITRLAIT